jgi:hypothetical protein
MKGSRSRFLEETLLPNRGGKSLDYEMTAEDASHRNGFHSPQEPLGPLPRSNFK